MSATTTIVAPSVEFFSGRQEAFERASNGSFRRMTVKEAANLHTGSSRDGQESHIGIFISPRQHGMVEAGFSLYRLAVNLTLAACERLRKRFTSRSAAWSKSELRYSRDRVHFAKTFAEFVIRASELDEWKVELSVVLSDPRSYESI